MRNLSRMDRRTQRADCERVNRRREPLLNVFTKKRNRILGKIAGALALLVCLLAVNPRVALAADPVDASRVCSLTLICRYEGKPLAGKRLRLYRVANGTSDVGFSLSGAFASSGVTINGLDHAGWSSAAATLSAYAANNSIAAVQSTQSDANGTALFSNLAQGLYLVAGDSLTIGTHTYYFAPFLVALPNPTDTGGWNYDITAYPKIIDPTEEEPKVFDITVLLQWSDAGNTDKRPSTVGITLMRDGVVYEKYILSAKDNWRHTWEDLSEEYVWTVVQTTSLDTYSVSYQRNGTVLVITDVIKSGSNSEDDGKDDSIPQTGILWWPVEALAAAGIVIFTIGWRKRFGDGGDHHAS